MRPLPSAVHIVTGVLLLNMLVALMDLPLWVYFLLFAAAPFLMIWLAWTVLRDRSVPVRDLQDGDEWGYQDRRDIAPVKD
jgi:membrane protein implicated in regulation of membrane protease activity